MKILVLGPYFGDIYNEILHFRNYVYYITSLIPYDKIIINGYKNRKFLYSNIPNLIFNELQGVNEKLSTSNVNILIDKKNYINIYKKFKEKLIVQFPNDELIFYTVEYSRFNNLDNYKKMFVPIDLKETKDIKNTLDIKFIIEIPLDNYVYESISEHYEVDKYDYSNVSFLLTSLNENSLIISNLGFYSFLSNLQGLPNFSYGSKNIAQYKEGGVYHLQNKNSIVQFYNENSTKKALINGILNFIKKVKV